MKNLVLGLGDLVLKIDNVFAGLPVNLRPTSSVDTKSIHELSYEIHCRLMNWPGINRFQPFAFYRERARQVLHEVDSLVNDGDASVEPLSCKFFVEVHQAMLHAAARATSRQDFITRMVEHIDHMIGQTTAHESYLSGLKQFLINASSREAA